MRSISPLEVGQHYHEIHSSYVLREKCQVLNVSQRGQPCKSSASSWRRRVLDTSGRSKFENVACSRCVVSMSTVSIYLTGLPWAGRHTASLKAGVSYRDPKILKECIAYSWLVSDTQVQRCGTSTTEMRSSYRPRCVIARKSQIKIELTYALLKSEAEKWIWWLAASLPAYSL